MKAIRLFLVSLILLAVAGLLAATASHAYQFAGAAHGPATGIVAVLAVVLGVNAIAGHLIGVHRLELGPTLTTPQLLLDVIGAFRKRFPAINMFGTQWLASPLKLNQKYIAQIAAYGTASTYDPVTGYANGANSARNGLIDVSVVTNNQPTYPLKWLHLDQIKDNKNQYGKVMAGAGYVLGKSCIDVGFFAKMTSRYFSKEVTETVANCDYDWLATLTGQLNNQGVEPEGRVLFVNTAVANILGVDPRMISKDYAGQLLGGQGNRVWLNVGGFALIQEYTDLPSNNGAQLTACTGATGTGVVTKVAHGLRTGDPVTYISGTTFTGFTAGTRYYAIRLTADTFGVALTRANAIAGTAVTLSANGTAGVFQLQENLIAFAADGRAFASLAGIPAGMTGELAASLGIVQTMTFDVIQDPDSLITMGAAKWQQNGTGDLFWCPSFVYGTNAGKEGDTALATNTAVDNSILAAATADGSACDYAGLRITSGASA
jgi:hypothetical protein